MELTLANRVWNRAAMEGGGTSPRDGDRALASMLRAHGLVMNGGVLHAVACLTNCDPEALSAARDGYRFFGFEAIGTLLGLATAIGFETDLGQAEGRFDGAYWREIPSDAAVVTAFERHFAEHPECYAPIATE